MKTILFLLLSASAMLAQVVPGRYILELSGDPAAVAAIQQGARSSARTAAIAARRTAVRQSQASARAAVAARGGTVIESLDTVFNGLIVSIADARAAELLQIPGAVKLHAVRRVQPLLNHALPLHKVPDAWNLLALGQNGAGAGIKIGMIDTGVDVNNPAFSGPLPPVDGFPKVLYATDTRFTNAKVIVAKNYTKLLPDGGEPAAADRDGHRRRGGRWHGRAQSQPGRLRDVVFRYRLQRSRPGRHRARRASRCHRGGGGGQPGAGRRDHRRLRQRAGRHHHGRDS